MMHQLMLSTPNQQNQQLRIRKPSQMAENVIEQSQQNQQLHTSNGQMVENETEQMVENETEQIQKNNVNGKVPYCNHHNS